MKTNSWKTAITDIKANKIIVRGYPVEQLIGNISYPATIYLLIKGKLPDENTARMLDAILVSSIDHGVTPPSSQAALMSASTGASLNAALAAGILTINEFHGAAIEKCMITLLSATALMEKSSLSMNDAAEKTIAEIIASGGKIWGYGHRLHSVDPRSTALLGMAKQHGFSGHYVQMGLTIVEMLHKTKGKSLPLNVDGAIAAILCEIGIPHEYANSFFIMARIPGLVAHIIEEKHRNKPMRNIDFSAAEYDGPLERSVKDGLLPTE